MKKLIISVVFILMGIYCGAQTVTATIADTKDNPGDDLTVKLDGMKRYKIYPAYDNYIYFNLDTVTGKLKAIKLSYGKSDDEIITLNDQDLSNGNTQFGVFELIQDVSRNCLLLNNQTGETWHIHYGVNKDNCWIKKVTEE